MNVAGLKALRKTRQLCLQAKQALNLLLLHTECHTRVSLKQAATSKFEKASKTFRFHVMTAMTRGQPCDMSPWKAVADEANTLFNTSGCLAAQESWQGKSYAPAGSLASAPPAAAVVEPSASPAWRVTRLPKTDPAATFASASASEAIDGRISIQDLTAPAPTGSPFDIAGRFSAFLDPNLIIWDPDNENAAFWIEPGLHLDQMSLLELAAAYPSAEVFIETGCDEDGCPAKPCDQRAVLEDLDADALRYFALAGIIDTMAGAVQRGFELLAFQIAGGQVRMPPDGLWSRRLVYCRCISPDTLMGCVQVHWHFASHDLIPLMYSLAGRSTRIYPPQVPQSYPVSQALTEPMAISVEAQTCSAEPARIQPAAAAQPQQVVAMVDPKTGKLHPASSDKTSKMPDSRTLPTTAEGLERPHVQTLDSLLPATSHPDMPPEPSIASSASRRANAGPPDASAELLKKLKEAEQQLTVKYSGSRRADRDRSDRDLLAHEKTKDRNRQAWAKLGKEPPPPKLSQANWEIKGAHLISTNPSAASSSIQGALPFHAPSDEPPSYLLLAIWPKMTSCLLSQLQQTPILQAEPRQEI